MRSLVTVIGSITSIAFRRGRGKIRMESGKFAGGGRLRIIRVSITPMVKQIAAHIVRIDLCLGICGLRGANLITEVIISCIQTISCAKTCRPAVNILHRTGGALDPIAALEGITG